MDDCFIASGKWLAKKPLVYFGKREELFTRRNTNNRNANENKKQYCKRNKRGKLLVLKLKIFSSETKKVPWKAIFVSKVCWATFVGHFCNNWGNYMFLTQLPTFMKDVLKFDIKSNGTMSAIPYIACALVNVIFGIVCDKLITSNILSRSNTRKIFNGLGK